MLASLSADSASELLKWSNRIYVTGAVLTLGSAAMVLYEKHSKSQGRALRWGLRTEIVVIVAAFISLCGTVGAISFGNVVSHLKDLDLDAYETQAKVQIAQAQSEAAKARSEAATANENALNVGQENIKLSGQVSMDAATARTAETALAKADKDTSDFAHALQQQQGIMQEQAKLSPVLTEYQISALANLLHGYTGQDVIIHSTTDTTVLRSKASVLTALYDAGITFKQNSMDMGALYQGISVAVHSPQDVPPLAQALVGGLRQAGIDAHPVAEANVPPGRVALYFGPN